MRSSSHPEQRTTPGLEAKVHEVVFVQPETRWISWPLDPTAAVCDVRGRLSSELQLILHHAHYSGKE